MYLLCLHVSGLGELLKIIILPYTREKEKGRLRKKEPCSCIKGTWPHRDSQDTHTHNHKYTYTCWQPLLFCLYHSKTLVRLKLTCDRDQMDSQQSVSPFLCLLACSSLPLLSLHIH